MKIAHLSDLHFTTFFKDNNLANIKYLLDYALEKNADHIIITGDLTDNATDTDFLILRQLFESYGILNSQKLSLVIGNHDIFGGVQTAEDIFSFPERCGKVNFNKQVNLFYNYFKETFDNCAFLSKPNIFPYAKILDGVLFVGINSIAEYSTSKNIFASNGSVGIDQFDETAQILEQFKYDAAVKIILIHHHFNKIKVKGKNSFGSFWQNLEKQTMKLRKKKRLFNLFYRYNIDLVLHGHFHEIGEYKRTGIKFLNAGGCLKNNSKNLIGLNFIDINHQGKITTKTVELKPEKTGQKIESSQFNYFESKELKLR
jgi:3',5'-cyclic AMP phosphodiesterase CpdA